MVLEEDRNDIYALYNTAKSMKYLGKYAYLKIQTPASMTWWKHPKKESFICKLYFVDISIDFSRDTIQSKEILVYFITHPMSLPEMEDAITSNEYHKKLFVSCMNRILNSKYISKEYKEEIRKRASKLDFLKS